MSGTDKVAKQAVTEGCWEIYEQHYSLELCFSIEKQTETVLSGGLFRFGARGSGQVEGGPNGSNDFDETLME